MNKKEKLIGSIVMMIGCTIFLVVGYILSKPKPFNSNENMFVEESNNKKGSLKKKDNVLVDKDNDIKNINKDELKKIVVEIKGEVKKPNVYTMNYGSRVNDLIERAGGFTEKADKMNINCSMKLKDEDCIVICNRDDSRENNIKQNNIHNVTGNTNNKDDKININTATKEELMKLPGVGEVTAQNIIDYREKSGGFNSVDEITKVNRIGTKTLDKFKDKIEAR
ncbi:competence protein [Clostridium botulinum C str. Eklund]|nr:competence protein [Clostridium botulinum C str. Eklund]NEZ49458.1 competence protein [Clostridium botulinum]